ncbi:MAG: uroporphyrinogen-III C-methyltransferase, partial [Actinomycetota bacterium]|nr:uroporphyrinogen-III C-methyltransferase [Actinomycetota bacterium]
MADSTRGYPVTLDLSGRRVLVVGGGPVATRRALSLVEVGARVEVVAPEATADLTSAAAAGRLTWRPRPYLNGDTVRPARAWLVHTATGTPADAQVAADCETDGVWCVRADDAHASSAWTPAVARGVAGSPAEG